ncbi:MAG: hypothetical protein ACR2M1_13030 [Gemmatimonadaceae bacterium]
MRLINPESTVARTNRSFWGIQSAIVVVFILVSLVSTPENGLGVAVTLGVLAVILQTKWGSRRDPRLWALIGIVGVVQLAAIFLIHIPRLSMGLVVLPFAAVEGLALWGLLNWMERRFPRT